MNLEVLEEVNQVSLMWSKYLLRGKLVHSELLDDFEDVNLFAKLALCVLEEEVFSLFPGATAAAILLIEAPLIPETLISVGEGGSALNFCLDFLFVVLFDLIKQVGLVLIAFVAIVVK